MLGLLLFAGALHVRVETLILTATFIVVVFSIIVQGLTIATLARFLKHESASG